jgi:hypothetical protein
VLADNLEPRWVQSDLGNSRAVAQGLKEAPVKLEESVHGILSEVSFLPYVPGLANVERA